MQVIRRSPLFALFLALSLAPFAAAQETDYAADVDFALEALEEKCGHFFKLKGIDWKSVSKQMRKDAKAVSTDQEHLVLLWRLLARLRDGHARVEPMERGKDVRYPEQPAKTGPGFFLCVSGKKVLIKNTWGDGAGAGLEAGMEVVKIDGEKPLKWLGARVEELEDQISFSTDHQAMFYACHWGLADPIGTRRKLELKDAKGKKKKRTLTYSKASTVPWGPAFFPEGTESAGDVNYAVTENGWGYLHVRRCKGELPAQIDRALAAIGETPGMIIDFRGNSGGGFDHDAVLGRFVPKGKTMSFAKKIPSAGEAPYGAPVVVIVDATCRSAGETGAGMFKEDGRAYMIGESPTAGMSSSKTTIELPSGLFALYVSVASNKSRFQGGRGIEGIGIEPHELVAFEAGDLAAGKDTLILRAEALLAKFPQSKVPYDPKDFQ